MNQTLFGTAGCAHTTRRVVPLCVAWAIAAAMLPPAATSQAQFGTPHMIRPDNELNADIHVERQRTQRWRAGIRIDASSGPCAGIYGNFSVPVDWPEQDVKVVQEEVSDTVNSTEYRTLSDDVRQLMFVVSNLAGGEQAEVTLTFEVTRRAQAVPLDTAVYCLPERPPPEVRKYLTSSPLIDSRSARIRLKAKELMAAAATPWEKVEALRNWVTDEVEMSNIALQGAVETLDQKKGNYEDLAGLFVALCRTAKVPARIVWVPNYCYAEFYLEKPGEGGQDAVGVWFPTEFKEKTFFGTVAEPYLILQKGDSIRVPESRERKRYVGEYVKVKSGFKPKVTWVRDMLGAGGMGPE